MSFKPSKANPNTAALQVLIESSGFLVFTFVENLEHRKYRPDKLDCRYGTVATGTATYFSIRQWHKTFGRASTDFRFW
ncbi:MAG: hypothetical protein P7H58_14055 [Microcoleus anatoxicus]